MGNIGKLRRGFDDTAHEAGCGIVLARLEFTGQCFDRGEEPSGFRGARVCRFSGLSCQLCRFHRSELGRIGFAFGLKLAFDFLRALFDVDDRAGRDHVARAVVGDGCLRTS